MIRRPFHPLIPDSCIDHASPGSSASDLELLLKFPKAMSLPSLKDSHLISVLSHPITSSHCTRHAHQSKLPSLGDSHQSSPTALLFHIAPEMRARLTHRYLASSAFLCSSVPPSPSARTPSQIHTIASNVHFNKKLAVIRLMKERATDFIGHTVALIRASQSNAE